MDQIQQSNASGTDPVGSATDSTGNSSVHHDSNEIVLTDAIDSTKTKSPIEVEVIDPQLSSTSDLTETNSDKHVPSTSNPVADLSKNMNNTKLTKRKHKIGGALSNKIRRRIATKVISQGIRTNKSQAEKSTTEDEVEVDVEGDNQNSASKSDSEYKTADVPVSSTQTPNIATKAESFELDKYIMDQLSSLDTPRTELLLIKDSMNDLERTAHQELLNLIEDKSPEVYLELRNHIISKWQYKKPNYVTKTDIRKDLARSVDIKTLNRMHSFLEQIGAINYGCSRVKYVRPLQKFMGCLGIRSQDTVQPKRCRRKKFLNNGEGGCTVSHGINGEIIDTMIINEDQPQPKKRVRKKPIYLIYCQPFNQRNGYHLQLHISALLLMDFHAHSSLSEVMGLIGGSWDCDTKVLSIMHYEPCKNAASSVTHCDMCPISQATSAERIHTLNMDLLGWFHSHPTFAPEPSQQDLETQQEFQECIGFNKPVIGIILTPFNKRDVLCSSDYRCLIVEKSKSDCAYTPYKLRVDVRCNDFEMEMFLENISRILLGLSENDNKSDLSFKDPYVYNTSITYMDKFISSARMTLERYISDINVRTKILRGIQDICK